MCGTALAAAAASSCTRLRARCRRRRVRDQRQTMQHSAHVPTTLKTMMTAVMVCGEVVAGPLPRGSTSHAVYVYGSDVTFTFVTRTLTRNTEHRGVCGPSSAALIAAETMRSASAIAPVALARAAAASTAAAPPGAMRASAMRCAAAVSEPTTAMPKTTDGHASVNAAAARDGTSAASSCRAKPRA